MSDIEQYSPVKPKLVKVNSTSGKYKNDVGHNTSANPTSRKYLSANYDQSSSNGKLSKFKSEPTETSNGMVLYSDLVTYPRNTAVRRKCDENCFKNNEKYNQHSYNYNFYTKRKSLEGKKSLDFMSYLGKRYNFILVIDKIFSFLDGKDLTAMSKVSQSWRRIIKYSSSAKIKQEHYLTYMQLEKENIGQQRSPVRRPKNKRTLTDVTNVISVVEDSPLNKIFKF